MANLEVHHPTLRDASTDAASTSAKVLASHSKIKGSTPQAISVHPGWQSSGALQACLTAWEKRLHDLAYEVATIGQNLGTANHNYKAADQRIVAQLKVLAELIQGTEK